MGVIHSLETAGAMANAARRLAWLCIEPAAFFQGPEQIGIDPNDFVTFLKVWPGSSEHRLLRSDGHVTQVTAG